MMFRSLQHRGWHHAVLLTAGVFLFVINLGKPALWDKDEGRNATAALEMLKSGDYVVPHFNGELRVDKPVLLYWLQTAAYQLFGIDEFAARLPSALASLLTLLLCYEMGRSMFGRTTGVLAALMLSTMPLMMGAARFANPDALLHLFMVALLFFFWQGQNGSAMWWVLFGGAGGLAVLAKGPVGLVLPLGIIGVYCLWTRQGRLLFRPALLLGILTASLVALPWYILVGVETKAAFLRGFLLEHNVNRYLEARENHQGFWLYYPAVLVVGAAPWSVFWWLIFWQAWKSWQSPAPVNAAGTGVAPIVNDSSLQAGVNEASANARLSPNRFLASWLGVVVLFFSLAATKLPNYALPALLPSALLAARLLVRWGRGEIHPPKWIMYWSLLSIGGCGLVVLLGTLIASGVWTIQGVRMRTYPGLENLAVWGVPTIVGAGLACWLMWRGRRTQVLWVLSISSVVFALPLALWGGASLDRYKAPRSLVEQAQLQRLDTPLNVYCYNVGHLPSLNFYARRDVTHCYASDELLSHLYQPTPAFLILPAREWETLKPQVSVRCRELAENFDMFAHENVVLISNR